MPRPPPTSALRDDFLYVKTAAENIFIGGENRWCANTRLGAKVQVIPRTPQAEQEARNYAVRALCVLLPSRPNEATLDSYDSGKPERGFRPHEAEGTCLAHDPDGSPCDFPPEPGKIYCFRHEYQFK